MIVAANLQFHWHFRPQILTYLSLAMLLCARAECEQLQGHVDGARSALAAARVIAEEVGSTAGAELHQAVERVSRLLRTA